MSRKSSPVFQWNDDEIQLLMEATENVTVKEDLQEDYKILSHTNCTLRSGVFLHSVVSFYKKLSFLFQALQNLH